MPGPPRWGSPGPRPNPPKTPKRLPMVGPMPGPPRRGSPGPIRPTRPKTPKRLPIFPGSHSA
eukprot:51749-Prorocentrum_minimum.AAC.2